MIDSSTGWFEIIKYEDKKSAAIANFVEKMWLCRYPSHTIIKYDRVN